MNNSSIYNIEVVNDFENLESVRREWVEINRNPKTDIDFFTLVCNSKPDVLSPLLLIIRRHNEIKTILVGRIEKRPIQFKIGYFTFSTAKPVTLVILNEGCIGDFNPEICDVILKGLMELISNMNIKLIYFNFLEINSNLFSAISSMPEVGCYKYLMESKKHWQLTIMDNFQDYLSNLSAKQRRNFKHLRNRIEKKYHQRLKIKEYNGPDRLKLLLKCIETIAQKTYQRGLNVGFIPSPEVEKRMLLLAEKGWLRGFVLFIDSIPCAFNWGYAYKGVFYGGDTAYDPTYRKVSAGTYLFYSIIQKLHEEKAKKFDFGLGDAEYKKKICDNNYLEAQIFIFSNSLTGLILKKLYAANVSIEKSIKKIAKKHDKEKKIKKWWRARKQPRDNC